MAENPIPGDEEEGEPQEGEIAGLPEVPAIPVAEVFSGDLTPEEDAFRAVLRDAAVGYARRGWRVIPVRWITDEGVCSCKRGAECPSPAKHPVHRDWPNVATSEPEDVAGWWREKPEGLPTEWFPRAGIGIVTGMDSGIFVLDDDTYAGGDQTLGAYERRHGDMPETRVHSTPRGGTHYIFRHPGFPVRNSAARVLGTGLDVRGEDGFIVAPPSIGANGSPYELNPAHDIDPAEAPAWLVDLLRGHDREQSGASISTLPPEGATSRARRYGESAVRANADRLRRATEGNRNSTLNEAAFSLGTLGSAGIVTEEVAWEALHEAALAAGLGEDEIRGTFLSGWRSGLKNPRQIHWNVIGQDWPVRARTGFGMADRMVDHYGDRLRYCPDHDGWMIYEHGVWRMGNPRAGEWAAQQMIRALPETEALSFDDIAVGAGRDGEQVSPREDFIAWVGTQQSSRAVNEAARLAAGLPVMQIRQADFDADPLLLNVRNGVVNLQTGELLSHDPNQAMTLQAAAAFYPSEPAPRWEQFLRDVQPDPEMRAYLQRVAGYCATGLTVEQAFFLMNGTGANGKSVFQSVIAAVLGSYSQIMPVETLMASSVDGRIPNDVARMAGKRFLVASESHAGKSLDEARLKALTGGDTMSARFMRGEWFEFRPKGKLQLTTNHLPRMSDDSATWRRIHLIMWPVQIPEEKRDGYLQDTLIREEAAGILRWIIDGAVAWTQTGLQPPRAVRAALDDYRQAEDIIGQFLADDSAVRRVPPERHVQGRSTASLWSRYRLWAEQQGYPVMHQRNFTSRVKQHGFEAVRSNGWSGFPELEVVVPGIGLHLVQADTESDGKEDSGG